MAAANPSQRIVFDFELRSEKARKHAGKFVTDGKIVRGGFGLPIHEVAPGATQVLPREGGFEVRQYVPYKLGSQGEQYDEAALFASACDLLKAEVPTAEIVVEAW